MPPTEPDGRPCSAAAGLALLAALGCGEYRHTCKIEGPEEVCASGSSCATCADVPGEVLEPLLVFPILQADGLPPVALARSSADWDALQDEMASGFLPFVSFESGTAALVVTVDRADGCPSYPWLDGVWEDGLALTVRIGGYYLEGHGCRERPVEDTSMGMAVVLDTPAKIVNGCAVEVVESLIVDDGYGGELPNTGQTCVGEVAYTDTRSTVPRP